MTLTDPIVPLNELLQINASLIAGLLVLLLVTKFVDRKILPSDDSFTIPRKLVGFATTPFALSSMIILSVDLFAVPSVLAILFSEMSTFIGFTTLIIAVVLLARVKDDTKITDEQSSSK